MPKLKVFGTALMISREDAAKLKLPSHVRQARVFVACPSMAAAARAFGISNYEARNYVGETGNESEVCYAMSSPGTVFATGMNYDKDAIVIALRAPKTGA